MSNDFKNKIKKSDNNYFNKDRDDFKLPVYDGKTHYIEVAKSPYFQALSVLRH